MTILCLIRHGATEWNEQGRLQGHSDIPLNELGRRQAEVLAERVADEPWGALWSSDLLRARQTAAPIERRTGLSVQIDTELRERCFGPLEGLKYEEVRERFPDYPGSDVPLPGIETREELRQRAMEAIAHLRRVHEGQRVLVVTHGAFINSILSVVSRGELGSGKTRLANAGINVLTWDGRGWEVDVVNDVKHLPDELS